MQQCENHRGIGNLKISNIILNINDMKFVKTPLNSEARVNHIIIYKIFSRLHQRIFCLIVSAISLTEILWITQYKD